MKITAAIDWKGSQVVRGVAGRREDYLPLRSCVARGAEPREVARGLGDKLGIHDLYIADLDAIASAEPNWRMYEQLLEDGRKIQIDAGIGDAARARQLSQFAESHEGVTGLIVGLESVRSRERLEMLCDVVPVELLVFSLDMKSGRPWRATDRWQDADPAAIAADVVELDIQRLILLDLAAVGVDGGCPTLAVCQFLRHQHPALEITTGGGVRGVDDLKAIEAAGCDGALVASALHDGRITREDLARFAAKDSPPTLT